MNNRIAGLGLAALMASTSLPAAAQDLTPINISYQPALYWALPFYVATEKGWWAELGLEPSFSTFPAGAPQIAAAQANDWDVGGTGSVPAVLGAERFGLKTVGITNDESAANTLMARNDVLEGLKADPSSIAGQSILITTNSTADYAAQACLRMWGVDTSAVEFVNLAQAQIISAIISRNGDIAGVWAPNTYTLQERADSDYLCSGADAGAIVPGALVVRPGFAEESPELVARFLAVYLRGWSWAEAHPEEAREMLVDFYSEGGVEISDSAVESEFAMRPTFLLDEQLAILDRADGQADVDEWLGNIGGFMASVGTFAAAPAPADFIDPSFMQMVADDPDLAAFANRQD
ncbi:ABC transporter substrate-binding protein [Halovulum dunhuangense]|uniref:ABC transporter substrate-binding protein n=1 Tax=Halovulum dunhuangense TaxID=1505036 RepID=A0A849L6S1_9RHOB|nr:ABC transporter substrate-binding protein [Halovulum dunhuangense]NNU81810.1 ABC transporter substrate-binding protein [Halovulum dunhuangense]